MNLSTDSFPDMRIGLVGAGYIAGWHGAAIQSLPGLRLTAVCDTAMGAAQTLAAVYQVPAFGSVDDLIAAGLCDAVHILTPPPSHQALALQCLDAGLHCFVEKPVALSVSSLEQMQSAAETAGRVLGVSHNFLAMPGYRRLKSLVKKGELGRVSTLQVNWCLPFAPLRSGPFGLWLLREPRNLLLELGPHLYAFVVDLFGPIDVQHLALSRPVELPGGGKRHQSWRILARAGGSAGGVEVTVNLSLVETIEDRSLMVRGSTGMARFDYGADTLIITRGNTADLVLNPLAKELSLTWQHLREGMVNGTKQALSLNQKSPYALSFRGAIAGFYDGIRTGNPDPRFSAASAKTVMQAIDDTLGFLPASPAPIVADFAPCPKIMVIGGTGFIGRALTRALVAKGHDVRVVSRGRTGPFDDIANHVETVAVDLGDSNALKAAMAGIDVVFNLARAMETTWDAALTNEVGTTLRLAEAALAAGVKRLIHTGTIASYDMSNPATIITETVGFGDMTDRNIYARSKAASEFGLLSLYRDKGLPLVIARPGIVLGTGGPLQHWGIGRWHGAGAVRLWGNGHTILPFVLVDDVADGLIRMMENTDILGKSFNLTGEPLLTGRQYFDAIHARLGAQTRVTSGYLQGMWLVDAIKYRLKRHVLHRTDAAHASLADWKSRGHLAKFDNSYPKTALGWKPESDRAAFLDRAITTGLFGF